jgi:hypothetical protein
MRLHFYMFFIQKHTKISIGNNRNFVISPEIISVEKIYSHPYFKKYYKLGGETLGDYISKYYKYEKNEIVSHNNWMKSVCGIDRVNQIKLGLMKLKERYLQNFF